jgi:prepilin-type N-terminal cleavage/methylation domain-containing protein
MTRLNSGTKRAFTIIEMVVVIFIITLLSGVVAETINKSYADNRKVEAQSITQKDINFAIDRLSRVLRSATLVMETTETNLKVRGYPNTSDAAPSEINFYLSDSSLKYSVIPPTGSAPNYTYDINNAKYYTLLSKTTNSVSNPVFRYYNDQGSLLNFPVSAGSVKEVEPNLSALDSGGVLKLPIVVSTKITLRNFKTNL